MKCAWQALLHILPIWMRHEVELCGKDRIQELRLRLGLPPQLIGCVRECRLDRTVSEEDLTYCVNVTSEYSPWAAESIVQGYLTAPGGHRVGLCGSCTLKGREVQAIKSLRSLCIRVSRDFPGIASGLKEERGSILIIGAPGWGKTTLLRDLIRQKSEHFHGSISVVDEKKELFPMVGNMPCYYGGRQTDILSGCPKDLGIEMALRNMGPSMIAVDEITSHADCEALIHAGWCGVSLMATAHAGSMYDLQSRPIYRKLLATQLFTTVVVLHADKSWHVERMN